MRSHTLVSYKPKPSSGWHWGEQTFPVEGTNSSTMGERNCFMVG